MGLGDTLTELGKDLGDSVRYIESQLPAASIPAAQTSGAPGSMGAAVPEPLRTSLSPTVKAALYVAGFLAVVAGLSWAVSLLGGRK